MTAGSILHTGTRMAAADDDRTNYDSVAITLHWIAAFLALFQFASAEQKDATLA